KRYQTIYAVNDGSVAAPTAGLHFTDNVLGRLKEKGIEFQYITLHVGLGTFRPIKTETLEDHIMHEESVCVSRRLIESILNFPDKKIIAVGTTALRTLESIYWFGLRLYSDKQKKIDKFYVSQWQPYEYKMDELVAKTQCLEAIIDMMENKNIEYLYGDTRLMVVPCYDFQIVDALISNFHMPCSSLLLLIAAFVGNDWKKIYDYALKNDFRFLSYGDSSLLFRN
ncbi:MAG: S-adenosylmethionine:tRNA ribosyltransferase-isomerase, partial [Bacteroidetes bacterium]|nr:S-adenosylmethionine:tRNA ribosyltransferase-isomerase [Bacteroidota bacterium]